MTDEVPPPHPPAHPPVHTDVPEINVDAGDLPTAAEAQNEFQAEAIRAVLIDAGISSIYVPSGSSLFGFSTAPGRTIPVKVLPQDLSRAKEVLSRAKFVGRSVDWDDVDVGDMPPEVRTTLEQGRTAQRAGGFLVWLGAVVAALIALLVIGGIVVALTRTLAQARMSLAKIAAPATAALALVFSGCTYQLHGRAVEGFGSIEVTEPTHIDANNRPIQGARIELIRDHSTGNRERVATATSASDGTFVLTVEAFGAGWMEEQWLMRASRTGFQNVEMVTNLPASPGGRLLLVTLAKGRSEKFREPESQRSLMDEARQYDKNIGSSPR